VPIPDFQTLLRPLLEFASDKQRHSLREAREWLGSKFTLTHEEFTELLPSGRQSLFGNRVAWAKVYLSRAGLLDAPERGFFCISERGLTELGLAPERITTNYLNKFPEFVQFRSGNDASPAADEDEIPMSERISITEGNPSNEETGIEKEVPEELNIAVPFDPDQIEVTTKAMTIDLILSRIASGAIDLQPDFQRRWGIWSVRRQSRLIESLLLRIPLPTFYAAEDVNENWEVVDGIQRLSTIARFIQPELLHGEGFALEGLEYLHEFEGRYCAGLSARLQRRLRETELVVHLIRHGTPLGVKFNIFARINTGGMALTAQELRHAIIPGIARKILEQWSKSEEFKRATADSVRDNRMEDRELVLRFIAFWMIPYEQYRNKDLDGFLADAMKRLNVLTDESVEEIRQIFERSMTTAFELFETDAFRKRYRKDGKRSLINKALFEAFSVNLAKLTKEEIRNVIRNREQLQADFITLCNDREFDSAVSQGTGNPNKVGIRFSKIAQLLKKVS
jgi:hypothetical protein